MKHPSGVTNVIPICTALVEVPSLLDGVTSKNYTTYHLLGPGVICSFFAIVQVAF